MTGLLIQEFKTLIKSPASISILVIPLVLLVGLGYLLPSGWIVPSSITIGIVAAVLLYFGGSIEEIKRTSFMKSISLTRLSKFTFLATKILFAMIVSMISVLWVLLFSWIFTATPIAFLATDFSNLLGNVDGSLAVVAQVPFDINWEDVQWFAMIYAGIITIVVAVSLSFIFVAFAKSSLSFYLMSFGYLLAMILFGGVVMPGFLISPDNGWFKNLYYFVPNFYTNNVMADAFSGGILNSIKIKDIYVLQLLNKVDAGFGAITDVLLSILHPANLPDGALVPGTADFNSVNNLFFGADGVIGGRGDNADWDGSLSALNAWKDAIILADPNLWTNNLDVVYNSLAQPLIDSGFESYPILIGETIQPILVNLFSDSPTISAVIGGLSAEGIGKLLWDNSGLYAIAVSAVIDLPAIFINIYYHGALGDFDSVSLILTNIEGTLHSLVGTLNQMAEPSSWYDWVIPWLEGALFLGISIKFFKWS